MAPSHLPLVLADTYRSFFDQVPVIKIVERHWSSLCYYSQKVPALFVLSFLGVYEEHLCDRMCTNNAC